MFLASVALLASCHAPFSVQIQRENGIEVPFAIIAMDKAEKFQELETANDVNDFLGDYSLEDLETWIEFRIGDELGKPQGSLEDEWVAVIQDKFASWNRLRFKPNEGRPVFSISRSFLAEHPDWKLAVIVLANNQQMVQLFEFPEMLERYKRAELTVSNDGMRSVLEDR